MQKRGQVTVFILLGIFILASTAVFLYLRKDRASLGETETIPPEFQPLKNYVEDCLLKYTQSGVILLGTQGGYTALPDRIINDPASAIAFSPNNPIRVPLWQYGGENRVPSVQDMERQINDYVLGNINQCLQGFSAFKDKFTVLSVGTPVAKTTIGDGETIITLTMPLDATIKGTSDRTRISKFNAQVSVKLRKIHSLATDIFNAAREQFFEDLTLELMTAGTKIPFSDISLSCKKPKWNKRELADYLKDLLYYNLPRVRFAQTNYPPFLSPLADYEQFRGLTPEDVREGNYPKDAPDDLYEYYHFLFPSSRKSYADLTAGAFFDPSWLFRFDAKPSKGETLEASGGRGEPEFLKFLCVNAYHFTYDVEYPVQIVVRDPEAFGGYAFRFAVPVRIRSNAPDHSGTGVTFFDMPDRNENYCAEQRDEEFYAYAKDARTGEDLSDANITFTCLNQFTCDVGSTDFDGNANRLHTKLPAFCRPGSLHASKEGYVDAVVDITDPNYADIPLTKLRNLRFRVVKQTLSGDTLGDTEFLANDEQAVLMLTAPDMSEYDAKQQYPAGDVQGTDIPLMEADTTYDVTLILLDTDNEPIGGWIGNWTTTADAVYAGNEVIFTAMEVIPHPADDAQEDMLEAISNPDRTQETAPQIR